MKLPLFGLLTVLVAAANCEKICKIAEHELKVPDNVDCEKFTGFISAKAENFRWPQIPSFPWITLPPRWPPFFPPNFPNIPNWTRRPRPTPPSDDDSDEKEDESCPDEGIHQIAHPEKCGKYILCINGNEFERSCASGFHFSRKEGACMPKRDAGCEDFERVWECPEEDDLDNLVFLPNTENCSKYYLCFNGQQIPFTCSDGLHWSIEKDNCLPIDDANCEFEDGEEDDYEECPESGVKSISHPSNCEKYILCVGGNPFERQCGPGLHFSRELRNCVAPEDAGCKERPMSCPEEDDLGNLVFLPNKEDCSMYYVCFGGEPLPLSCAKGLHWSVEQEACVDEVDAGCEDNGEDFEECPESGVKSISHPSNCEKYILCVGGNPFDRQCGPGLHFSRELRTCVLPEDAGCEDKGDDFEECPESGIKSISHPSNCEKYILCVGGNPFERQCGPGLHFSRDLRACVQPEDAGCEASELSCPEEDDLDNLKFLPNKKDCSMYYVCFGGDPWPLSCPDGLHWSVEEGNCVDKAEAGCEDHGDDFEECPESGIKSISHPSNCEKYILCVGGNPFERQCGPGLHFSRELRTCVLPEDAGCEADDFEQCPESGIEQIPHPDNCEKYVLCVGGTRIKRNCGPGLHFSPTLRVCVQPEDAGCDASPLTCPEEDDLGNLKFLPNEDNCSKYYLCFGGEQIPLACNEGLHWSTDQDRCMHPSEAGCEEYEQCPEDGIEQITHPSDCSMYVLCVGGTRIKRNCAPGFHFSREFRTCLPIALADCEDEDGEEEGFVCPKEDDLNNLIFLPSEESCEQYYICYQGAQVPFRCGNGLHWSRKNENCMLPADAGCKLQTFDFDCPEPTGLQFYSNPADCASYITCRDGRAQKEVCPSGFFWNRRLEVCTFAHLVDCP